MSEIKRLLCLYCGHVSEVDPSEVTECPTCHSTARPADLDDTVDIHITKHELRVLTIFASEHAERIGLPVVTRTILDRLTIQTEIPLSLEQELADVRQRFGHGNVKLIRGDTGLCTAATESHFCSVPRNNHGLYHRCTCGRAWLATSDRGSST